MTNTSQMALVYVATAGAAALLTVLLVRSMRSKVLGSLDLLASFATQKRNSFFPNGLRDRDAFISGVHALMDYNVLVADKPNIVLGPWTSGQRSAVAHAEFRSPASAHLPERSRTAHCQFVVSKKGLDATIAEGMPWVIHLAATGDEGFSMRRKHIAEPLLDRGIASAILQIPFYGKRRAEGQEGYQLQCVEHVPQQALGCVTEANAVAMHLRHGLGVKAPIIFTGISYGGAMAALSSSLYPHDHACVAMVPSHGPAPPFVEGVIAHSVCWDTMDLGQADGDVRKALHELFSEMDVTHMAHADDRDRARVYIQLTARDDHYVPVYSAMILYEGMEKARNTRAELRMMDGGHVTAILWHATRSYISAIEDAIARLNGIA